MARSYYLRPDQIYRSGIIRPASASANLQAEIASIARAFTSDPNTIAGEYGVNPANVPILEPAKPAGTTTDVSVRPGIIARFFGRKR